MVIEKAIPEMKNETAKASMLAAVNVDDLKNRSGTIGFSVRLSTTTNAAKRTAETANAVRISESPQHR
jgi:uncharacterized protein (DUF2141 family)